MGYCSGVVGQLQLLLTIGGSLVRLGSFSVKTFNRVSQVDPSDFQGVPLSDQ